MKQTIEIRKLTSLQEMRQVEELEEHIWGSPTTPLHQTHTAVKNGGIIAGAYDGEKLVGFQYSFPGYKNGQVYLCSHMLGIHSDYQKSGIGEKLKHKQRELAIEMGYSFITWTFDPLLSVNAYLNLHKLGGIAGSYSENHYGMMDDAQNAGLPTDRFKVEWWIKSNYVNEHKPKNYAVDFNRILLQTKINQDGLPYIVGKNDGVAFDPTADGWLVPIPADFQSIKNSDFELALDWRIKTREVFQGLLAQGFVGEDLIRHPEKHVSYYRFSLRNHLDIK
ncbi:predicted GNAT superfamily acetyltransferase [Bacillus oleivorans]|uniref:Predicted GNAT superfamily acetyltransferase n=1 Tax=Bacillus oleivorans TaxID=1448271 RepID=A0A285CI49_9BACI|nr:GNAT family N-acetyltransferase [Bacillus oleivorans]SNX67272.1 predicted GNAT superfamily acetyltransferase [Bacillus oleivorans]